MSEKVISNDIYTKIGNISNTVKHAIWGLNKDSFDIFTETINERIYIDYFIDDADSYNGCPMFDKSIIKKDELNIDDVVVLISEKDYQKNKEWINQCCNQYKVVKVGTLSDKIRNCDDVYIYGAGQCGKKTLQILKKYGVKIRGFIDSNEKKVGLEWCGYPIFHANQLNKDSIVIISTIYYAEIYNDLSKVHDCRNIYVDYRNSRLSVMPINYEEMNSIWIKYKDYPIECMELSYSLYTVLWNDIVGKRIILYGNNEITDQFVEIVQLLGIKIDYIIEDNIEEEFIRYDGLRVRDVFDLAYEDLTNTIIIIAKIDTDATVKNKKICIDSGRKLKQLGLKNYSQYRSIFSLLYAHMKSMGDKLLDYVEIYEKTKSDTVGFYIHKSKQQKKKIVVLGGSTSDYGLYENMIKSWPELLYEMSDFTIINGAIQGYDSVRECLKLLRDVSQMHPDLVISYSGVNECGRPEDAPNPFVRAKISDDTKNIIWQGMKNDIEIFDCWIMMEKYMQAISNVNGSDFIAIIQPALFTKKNLSNEEKRLSLIWNDNHVFSQKYKDFLQKAKSSVNHLDWMYDLSHAFDNESNTVYRDGCHLNEYGNHVIAENVYKIINDYYGRKGKIL